MKDGICSWILVFAVLLGTHGHALAEQASTVKEIVIVFKTHFDIGYTDYAESVLQNYSGPMITSALSIMDKTRALPGDKRFVWTLPGWPMHEILRRAEPETKERVEEAIRNGWFAVHGLPFTFHTEASGLEDLVRGLWFSADISRKYGLPLPEDAKMTDVPRIISRGDGIGPMPNWAGPVWTTRPIRLLLARSHASSIRKLPRLYRPGFCFLSRQTCRMPTV